MAIIEINVSLNTGEGGGLTLTTNSVSASDPTSVFNFKTDVNPGDYVIWKKGSGIHEILSIYSFDYDHWNVFKKGPAPIRRSVMGYGADGSWYGQVGSGHDIPASVNIEEYMIVYTTQEVEGISKEDPKIQLHRT